MTTQRFSNVGLVAILMILATGIINALNLVGSFHLLITTDYGRLLLLKVLIFLIMVAIASVNRFALAPRLNDRNMVGALGRNVMIETICGIAIVSLVAALGTMPPALQDSSAM